MVTHHHATPPSYTRNSLSNPDHGQFTDARVSLRVATGGFRRRPPLAPSSESADVAHAIAAAEAVVRTLSNRGAPVISRNLRSRETWPGVAPRSGVDAPIERMSLVDSPFQMRRHGVNLSGPTNPNDVANSLFPSMLGSQSSAHRHPHASGLQHLGMRGTLATLNSMRRLRDFYGGGRAQPGPPG